MSTRITHNLKFGINIRENNSGSYEYFEPSMGGWISVPKGLAEKLIKNIQKE